MNRRPVVLLAALALAAVCPPLLSLADAPQEEWKAPAPRREEEKPYRSRRQLHHQGQGGLRLPMPLLPWCAGQGRRHGSQGLEPQSRAIFPIRTSPVNPMVRCFGR